MAVFPVPPAVRPEAPPAPLASVPSGAAAAAAPPPVRLTPSDPPDHLYHASDWRLVPPGTALGVASAALGVGIARLAREAGYSRHYVGQLVRGLEPPWAPGIERCWLALTRLAVAGAREAREAAEARGRRDAAALLADKDDRRARRVRRGGQGGA